MLRVRRYRVFLFATALILGAVYYLGSGLASGGSLLGPAPPPSLKDFRFDDAEENPTTPLKPVIDDAFWVREKSKAIQEEEARLQEEAAQAKAEFPQIEIPGAGNKMITSESSSTSQSSSTSSGSETTSTTVSHTTIPMTMSLLVTSYQSSSTEQLITETAIGTSTHSSTYTSTEAFVTPTHWVKQKENFPVPTESLVQLPTGKPKEIPRIQFDFSSESSGEKVARQERLDAISASFLRTWNGYKEFAWGHDELKPKSGGSKDPFCGWAATLVDALDTLWIMNLKEEFAEAVKAVAKIDFTTTRRAEIPLFETTIRYLGGLLGAYDVSGRQYPVLLEKAVELAEVLIGAFDTPNRMPLVYYGWSPATASKPQRASTNIVLAELGSLSVEFTRLAQLTTENKYYDAVARITDALELWQNNTRLPGLWPLQVDASGCEMPQYSYNEYQKHPALARPDLPVRLTQQDAVGDDTPLNNLEPPTPQTKDSSSFGTDPVDVVEEKKNPVELYKEKDHSSWANDVGDDAGLTKRFPPIDPSALCKPVGLASHAVAEDKFTIGGMADSVYEYLPKEWLLLGGINGQYQSMYEAFIKAFEESLLYRPMIKEDDDILFSGTFHTNGLVMPDGELSGRLDASTGHLSCFVGGLIGMGSKIFNRKSDLEMAIKLTQGCVWAYNSTLTGIMPEHMRPVMCESLDECAWNETRWYDEVDPHPERRGNKQSSSPAYGNPAKHQPSLIDLQKEKDHALNDLTNGAKTATDAAKDEVSDYADSVASKAKEGIAQAADAVADKAKEVITQAVDATGEKAKDGLTKVTDTVKDGLYDAASAIGSKVEDGVSSAANALKEGASNSFDAAKSAAKDAAVNGANAVREGLSDGLANAQTVPDTLNTDETAELAKSLGRRQLEDMDNLGAGTPDTSQSTAPKIDYSGLPNTAPPPINTDSSDEKSEKVNEHEEYAKNLIKFHHLWPGMVDLPHKGYILRPEAIESVFYMYRITGDETWREKGWNMWQSIDKATKTVYGNSAIADVTAENVKLLDQAESFWLSETLKYFYLLFSDPSVISLDDYVLNTEAHPFLRPDTKF